MVHTLESGDDSMRRMFQFKRPLPAFQVLALAQSLVDTLVALEKCKIVHADIKPENLVLFHTVGTVGSWKLVDFDASCHVGKPVKRATVDYASPCVFRAIKKTKSALAQCTWDHFAFGRLLWWLSVPEGEMWPNLQPGQCTHQDKVDWLVSEEEFSLEGVQQRALRSLIGGLVIKNPAKRLSLEKVRKFLCS
jgi:serine/threonine protein kinase